MWFVSFMGRLAIYIHVYGVWDPEIQPYAISKYSSLNIIYYKIHV